MVAAVLVLAAAPGPARAQPAEAGVTHPAQLVVGPLELFPGLTRPAQSAGLPGGPTGTDAAPAGQPALEEEVVLQLVRAEMSAADRALLDDLLATAQTQQQEIELGQSILATADEELSDLAVAYLLEPEPGPMGAQIGSWIPEDGGSADSGSSFAVSPGWIFPVAGPHTFRDTFGAPRDGGKRKHKGCDIFCARNTPLVAVVNGVIRKANPVDIGLGGRTVTLWGDDDNSYYYAHLESLAAGLHAGMRVEAGQVIGYAGNTGNARATSVHLHFGIRPGGGEAINPYPVLMGAATIDDIITSTTTTTTTSTTTTSTTTTSTTTTTDSGSTTTVTMPTTDTTEPPATSDPPTTEPPPTTAPGGPTTTMPGEPATTTTTTSGTPTLTTTATDPGPGQ